MPTPTCFIAPSLLASDFSQLQNEMQKVEKAGADWLHLDVMDGHFVPNLTFGPPVIKALRAHTNVPFDVHLMIEKPELSVEQYVKAGANLVTVQAEACTHLHRTLKHLQDLGVKSGVAFNPATPIDALEYCLDVVDLVLIMSVNPGFGGQHFIDAVVPKIAQTQTMLQKHQRENVIIQVDGGINPQTIVPAAQAGARCFVAGSAIFAAPDYAKMIKTLRHNAAQAF